MPQKRKLSWMDWFLEKTPVGRNIMFSKVLSPLLLLPTYLPSYSPTTYATNYSASHLTAYLIAQLPLYFSIA